MSHWGLRVTHTHTSGGSIQRRRARRGSWSRCMDVIPMHRNDQENDIRRSCQFNQINQHHLDLSGLAILGRARYFWGPPVGDLSSRALSLKLIQISWSLVALSVSVHGNLPLCARSSLLANRSLALSNCSFLLLKSRSRGYFWRFLPGRISPYHFFVSL